MPSTGYQTAVPHMFKGVRQLDNLRELLIYNFEFEENREAEC